MCYQECALYGELVLWLRDQAAGLLAGAGGDVDAENVALICRALEDDPASQTEEAQIRLCQHRDLVLALAQVVPPAARLWLQGWLEATAHGAFAADLPF